VPPLNLVVRRCHAISIRSVPAALVSSGSENAWQEASLKKSGKCPKCDSTNIVVDAKVHDRGRGIMDEEMSISTYRKPDALVFKETRLSNVSAWACAACGYIELYADEPQILVL
jgi:predicted nucleic-acid-binding Zn-ribbon protein